MFEALHKVAEIVGPNYPPKGLFEAYSIVGGVAITEPASWDDTWNELDRITGSGESSNGTDVRRATQ